MAVFKQKEYYKKQIMQVPVEEWNNFKYVSRCRSEYVFYMILNKRTG